MPGGAQRETGWGPARVGLFAFAKAGDAQGWVLVFPPPRSGPGGPMRPESVMNETSARRRERRRRRKGPTVVVCIACLKRGVTLTPLLAVLPPAPSPSSFRRVMALPLVHAFMVLLLLLLPLLLVLRPPAPWWPIGPGAPVGAPMPLHAPVEDVHIAPRVEAHDPAGTPRRWRGAAGEGAHVLATTQALLVARFPPSLRIPLRCCCP